MSDAPDYDSYLSSKVQHEVERLRAALVEVGPGLLVLRNMCRRANLRLGEERAKQLIAVVRAALKEQP